MTISTSTTAAGNSPHLWLRAETKKNEQRTALSPDACVQLINQGFQITIEECPQRIFNIDEYIKAGCTIAPHGSWQKDAPKDAYVIALKELPENDDSPLSHAHIMFGHCYKDQAGWKDFLLRFMKGNGLLLDLEFLFDGNGRRVAAFGYHAGFAGSALGIDYWCHQQLTPEKPYLKVKPYGHENLLIEKVKKDLASVKEKTGKSPKIMVMGALGRCGTGACDFASRVDLSAENIVKWDMSETAKGGPFDEIVDVDIFVNCIYLSKPIPPFLTSDQLNKVGRQLSVVVDVSCDTTNPNNPIPIYKTTTTFDEPIIEVKTTEPGALPIQVIAIDHLPTLLPREASEAFIKDLLPHILLLKSRKEARVWNDAEELFNEKCALIN